MLKLKLQYFGHPMRRVDSLEKSLMLGGTGGRRRRVRQSVRWLDGITDSIDWVWVNSRCWWWTGRPGVLQFMGLQRVGDDWATELKWTRNLKWENTWHVSYGLKAKIQKFRECYYFLRITLQSWKNFTYIMGLYVKCLSRCWSNQIHATK